MHVCSTTRARNGCTRVRMLEHSPYTHYTKHTRRPHVLLHARTTESHACIRQCRCATAHTRVCPHFYSRVYAPTRTCYGHITLRTYASVYVPNTHEPRTVTTNLRQCGDTPTRAGHGCGRIHTLEHTHSYTHVQRIHSNIR